MSGGHFHYAFTLFKMNFVQPLRAELNDNDQDHSPETLEMLREILADCERAAALAREVEWLFSYDHGEESFAKRVKLIREAELQKDCI